MSIQRTAERSSRAKLRLQKVNLKAQSAAGYDMFLSHTWHTSGGHAWTKSAGEVVSNRGNEGSLQN